MVIYVLSANPFTASDSAGERKERKARFRSKKTALLFCEQKYGRGLSQYCHKTILTNTQARARKANILLNGENHLQEWFTTFLDRSRNDTLTRALHRDSKDSGRKSSNGERSHLRKPCRLSSNRDSYVRAESKKCGVGKVSKMRCASEPPYVPDTFRRGVIGL